MNVREPKEAYIEQNETPIDQFGEHVGQAIARGENDFVLNKIADGPIEQVQVRRDSELERVTKPSRDSEATLTPGAPRLTCGLPIIREL
jgi:hypothetical protein